jgi:hypothetical protein
VHVPSGTHLDEIQVEFKECTLVTYLFTATLVMYSEAVDSTLLHKLFGLGAQFHPLIPCYELIMNICIIILDTWNFGMSRRWIQLSIIWM